ncbi:hypothetical protein JYU34_005138 [Plutella xylostella]|uniref:Tetratricopeptide repeat protein 25 n=1 Tax=Plutella xylostella TaxID=51655 RepID=A0ABQ7QVY4_PLUXY|nr:hypothetical protein JYU34_005138 [Plutella xylostella]
MEEKELFGALTVYRERGAYLRRLEQFDKSLAAYDQALATHPQDIRLLTGRSQTCADAARPAPALRDAERALALQPDHLPATHMQARALYAITEFERSLVVNHRGYEKRRQPPYFLEGINQGRETIQDCIGTNAGDVMIDFLPLIKKVEKKRIYEDQHPKSLHKCRIPKCEAHRKLTQAQARRRLMLSRVLAMKYLGPMAYDKFFLQDRQVDPRLDSANAAGSRELRALVDEALRSLIERQDMLHAQRPYYSIKLAEKTVSKHHSEFMKAMLEAEQETSTRTADRLIQKVENSMRQSHVNEVISQAERMQTFLDKKTPRTLPDKEKFIDRLYRAVGEGYLLQHRLSYSLSERGNRRRIAFLMGLPTGRPRSFDSVMANYPYKFHDLKTATEKLTATLDMCENSTQRCWLYYELSRLTCAQKNYSLAKFYAKRCQREAEALNSPTWFLNGCFAVMSGDMQQGNANDVRETVDTAMEWSGRLPEPGRVQEFLGRCAEVAGETAAAAADERRAAAARERQLLQVMDPAERTDMRVLLKRMAALPAGRRGALLPGPRRRPSPRSERRRRLQRGLTVVPGPDQALPAPPKSDVLGFQVFDF